MSLTLSTVRKFPTEHVLCVATKYIPDAEMLPGVYSLLEHMTGGAVSTPDLKRAMNEAHRFLLFRHPHLSFESTGGSLETEELRAWFEAKRAQLGESIEIRGN